MRRFPRYALLAGLASVMLSAASLCNLTLAPGLELLAARADETVLACNAQPGPAAILTSWETFGIKALAVCGNTPAPIELFEDGQNQVNPNGTSGVVANAPPGLLIAQVTIPSMNLQFTVGTGYVAYVTWSGGEQRIDDTWTAYNLGLGPPVNSVGLTLGCAGPNKCPVDDAHIFASNLELDVVETTPPAIVANGGNNLWYKAESEWVRGGGWSIAYTATAPSGIESMSASEGGQAITSPLPPTCVPNDTQWQECPGSQSWSPTVTLSGNGPQALRLSASSTAGNTSPYTETINVDNVQPSIALNGTTQAVSTAGTQYVIATATVGPSGLRSINCSVDGGPNQSFASSPAEIPVSGDGNHTISCTATNQAYDVNGQPATSAPATWQIDIGQPTVSGIAFTKLVDGLRCRKVKERVKVSARSAGHRRGRTETKKVVKCHARTARRRVTVLVKVRRHGKVVLVKRRKIERVVVSPHVSSKSVERIRFGKAAIVDGWLGTSAGVALSGRSVVVMTAPENGLGQWSQAAVVTTAPNGSWAVQLPSGPSRLVQAAYSGDPTTLPSTSTTVRLTVPAKLKLHVSPRRTRWGRTIRISGRVLGGYIPAGKLLRLRIGVEGVRGTVGIPSIGRDGRFHTTWTFSAGHGVVRYWFSVSTLNEADYPFAPASSKRVYVTVR